VIGIVNKYRSSFADVRVRISVGALALILFALAPAAAFASDPTAAQYSSSLSQISQGGNDAGTASSSAAGGLPFTGLDVALLAAVAGGLLLAGFLLRRQRPTE
jgi:hypothetical protein